MVGTEKNSIVSNLVTLTKSMTNLTHMATLHSFLYANHLKITVYQIAHF